MRTIDMTPTWGEWANIYRRFAESGEAKAVRELRAESEAKDGVLKKRAEQIDALDQKLARVKTMAADEALAELRAEAARLAVELASGKLAGAVQKADHDRFVQDYLGKVGQL